MLHRLLIFFSILASGILGALIYPTVFYGHALPNLGFFAWIYLTPLLISLGVMKGRGRFLASFIVGLLTYGISLYWLTPAMMDFGGLSLLESSGVLILIIVILALYFSTALQMAYAIHDKTGLPLFLLSSVFLLSFDYLRTYFPVNGFPWSMPAYSQGSYLSFFQWVDVTGVFGLNLAIYLVNGLFADMFLIIKHHARKEGFFGRLAFLMALFFCSFFGSLHQQEKMAERMGGQDETLVALIQGNIAQDLKWDMGAFRMNLETYTRLTDKAAASGAELVLWPETAYPFTVELSDLAFMPLVDRQSMPVPVLFGAVSEYSQSPDDIPKIYNSAFLMGRDAKIQDLYHKRHLVPFGEYVPFKKWLTFARRLTVSVGDFTPGEEGNLIDFEKMKMGLLICYEDIFPDLARQATRRGANILVNLTNDAWYGDTSAQYQHLVFSQFRALENRRYLLRATNTGVSAIIDPRGKVLSRLAPFTEEVLLANVSTETTVTPYARLGDFVAWLVVALSAVSLIAYGVAHFSKPRNDSVRSPV